LIHVGASTVYRSQGIPFRPRWWGRGDVYYRMYYRDSLSNKKRGDPNAPTVGSKEAVSKELVVRFVADMEEQSLIIDHRPHRCITTGRTIEAVTYAHLMQRRVGDCASRTAAQLQSGKMLGASVYPHGPQGFGIYSLDLSSLGENS
jgi:hypothetical protein